MGSTTERGASLKHVQVREYVRTLLAEATPGSPAPSERELAARFGVARMTVRQALDALVAEGRIERVPGRGTFVAEPRRSAGVLTSFTQDMARRGQVVESQTLLVRHAAATPAVARALSLEAGSPVIHWRRLRCIDGEAICVADIHLNEALLPGLLRQSEPNSLYAEFAARGLGPTWAEDSLVAAPATHEEATLLGTEPGAPVLQISRRSYAGANVLEVSKSVLRGDRFTAYAQFESPAPSAH